MFGAGPFGVFAVVLVGAVDVAVGSAAHAGAARRSQHHQVLARSGAGNATHDNSTFSLEPRGPRSRWTWYHTETGNRGSCGDFIKNSDFAVARAAVDMGNNRDCNKVITLEFEGRRAQAIIKDTCPECPPNALDLSKGLFKYIAPNGDGVVYGNWWFGGEGDGPDKEKERKEKERKERERKEREERERKEREERERKERERKERERKERERKEKEEAEERERQRKLKEEEERAKATPTPVIPADDLDLDVSEPVETGTLDQAVPALQQILVQFGSVVAAGA